MNRRGAVGDVLQDVTVEMHARRARAGLMMAAVALSTGSLLSAVGISGVAAQQVDADLAASTLNLVSVGSAPGLVLEDGQEVFPPDTEIRAAALDLVQAAGRRINLDASSTPEVTRTPGDEPVADVTVAGLTSGYLSAAAAPAPAGWMLGHERPVALLGSEAAAALSIPLTADPTGFTVHIDSRPHAVVGFLPEGDVDLSRVVAIPYRLAVDAGGGDVEAQLLVRTAPGAGTSVAEVIRLAVRPDAPQDLRSSQVVDVSHLRTDVSTQMDRLAAGVGGLLLMLTILLIGNAMIVSVMSRTSEIGLRRAMGASRWRVAALFWVEGGLSGALGGLAGSALSAVAVVAVAAVNGWTASMGVWWVTLGPVIGLGAGLVSSLYPAWRAASIEPAQAVRAD